MRTGVWILLAAAAALTGAAPALSATHHLVIEQVSANFTGRDRPAVAINGQIPGPTLRWREGEEVTIHVTNRLPEDTSVHWHGIVLPNDQDGVPGLTFPGIAPGETFTYRFTPQQAGTYWYHSHSGLQAAAGMYAPLVIEPRKPDGIAAEREHIVLLSDWHDDDPWRIMARLKKYPGYYNRHRRTLADFFRDLRATSDRDAVLQDRLAWARMRMDPTDLADVAGYTFLANGKTPEQNWTGLFTPGERVRLRLINASAMTYFDFRIPGLSMTVVEADGQAVEPVTVDELRLAVAETFDVIVTPENRAYTLFAEAFDRTGYARGTLAPSPGLAAGIPPLRPRPLLTMADMGHGEDGHGAHEQPNPAVKEAPPAPTRPGHGASAPSVGRSLAYADLRAPEKEVLERTPDREIEVRLGGNMERFIWTINGRAWPDAEPIRLHLGERVRFRFINDDMMNHPMHLHGMWMRPVNGQGSRAPRKHVVNIPPGQEYAVDIDADAPGHWAFHCHLAYHMEAGMFRVVTVSEAGK